jgi:hypothetical protein
LKWTANSEYEENNDVKLSGFEELVVVDVEVAVHVDAVEVVELVEEDEELMDELEEEVEVEDEEDEDADDVDEDIVVEEDVDDLVEDVDGDVLLELPPVLERPSPGAITKYAPAAAMTITTTMTIATVLTPFRLTSVRMAGVPHY